MTLPSQLATDTSHRWMSIPEAARYFGKDRSVIWKWCSEGTAAEAGFKVFRDPTRHMWIGIPIHDSPGGMLQSFQSLLT